MGEDIQETTPVAEWICESSEWNELSHALTYIWLEQFGGLIRVPTNRTSAEFT